MNNGVNGPFCGFTDNEKIKYFDLLCNRYYDRNFGRVAKSDMDALMFHFYMDKLIEQFSENGVLNYAKCSDYAIAKQLGITQQKVRSLKINEQLLFPKEEWRWEKSFISLIGNARYDQVSRKVTINIPDPNLYIEIQNFIEEKGGYVDVQLNSKVLQIKLEYFFELAVAVEGEDLRKDVEKELKMKLKEQNKLEKGFDNVGIGKMLERAGDVASIISSVIGFVNPTQGIAKAIVASIKGIIE